MKEKTSNPPGAMGPRPDQLGDSEQQRTSDQQAARPDKIMQTEYQTRRARGRLSREDQRRLGDVLQRVYDDVLQQGVPDRFKSLIDQLGQSDAILEVEAELTGSNGLPASEDPEPEHGVQARSGKSKDER